MKLNKITPLQCRDACQALTFLLLLFWFVKRIDSGIYAAMCTLILGMSVPNVMKPVAWVWFGLAEVLSQIISTMMLSFVYLVLVLPVGIIRRILGYDTLLLKCWGKDTSSYFIDRNVDFTSTDLHKPY